jgi:hypothetical protein
MAVLALYRGLASGQMSVAATLSAIAMVSWQPGSADPSAVRAGVLYGALAGLGFALLFVALDQAGTHAGAWPLSPARSWRCCSSPRSRGARW